MRVSCLPFLSLLALGACQPDFSGIDRDAPVEDAGPRDGSRPPPPDAPDEPDEEGPEAPPRLSDTGLYRDVATRELEPGVIEYAPRYPLWSDGVEKKRYLLLPPDARIDTSNMDHWLFPIGTKLWKEFSSGGRPIETRLLSKVTDEDWAMVAYLWRDDEADADALPEGRENARGTAHDVPSKAACRRCHTYGHGIPLSVGAVQLSNGGDGLLSRLVAEGRLSHPPAEEYEIPGDELERAALGTLHANCGHCHNDHAGLHAQTPMRLALRTTEKTLAETGAYRTTIGTRARHVIPPGVGKLLVPGDPEKSQLYVRMVSRGNGWAMPPLATEIADPGGSAIVHEWIRTMP